MRKPLTTALGFTLIEMIVSLAVFSVVVTISVGALLSLIYTNEQLQVERSVMTNLSFALDSMAREIRTGTDYICGSANNLSSVIVITPPIPNFFNENKDLDAAGENESGDNYTLDCQGGRNSKLYHGVVFTEAGDSITGTGERILYFYNATEGKIYRRIGTESPQSIVSSDIFISDADFFVTGSKPLSDGPGNLDQPAVTIFIEARKADDPTGKLYRIQTTVVQRTLDL